MCLIDDANVAHGNSLQMRDCGVQALGDVSWGSFMSSAVGPILVLGSPAPMENLRKWVECVADSVEK